MTRQTIIIGAGISGLAAAYYLKRAGLQVLLLESSNHRGGVIGSLEADGFLIERGPNSLRGSYEFLDLVEELELTDELLTGDAKAPAYVYAEGELQAVPMSVSAFIKTRLISASAKFRLLGEPFIRPRREAGEESIASFVRRRLGAEILDRLVSPFVSGVYAGDVEQLSIQAGFAKLPEFESTGGSILRGALRASWASRHKAEIPKRSLRPYRMCSFRRGLQTLPRALSENLGESLLTQARVTRITERQGAISSSGFAVSFEHQGKHQTVTADSLILATPSNVAASLLGECAPEVAALISDIPYAGLASVPLGYREEQLSRRLDGFGFLAPRSAGVRTLGSVWNSSLFSGRAPTGFVCLTNYIGGATDPIAVTLPDDELIRIVHEDLQKVLGIRGEPLRLPVTRWQRALPQYVLGHASRLNSVEEALRHRKGLFLSGNYLRGISLADCLKQAKRVAQEAAQYIFNSPASTSRVENFKARV